jgi:hypothetical protein
MSTLDLIAAAEHVGPVSNDVLSTIAVAVVLMLLGFALEAVKGLVVTFVGLMRPMMAAARAGILIALALAIAAAVLVVQALGV